MPPRNTLVAALAAAAPATAFAGGGEAVLRVMPGVDHVQRSNYANNSFRLENTGGRDIVAFELDVSTALYPDCVFDPEGKAGDNVAKPLQINTPGDTGVLDPANAPGPAYVGEGGDRGYRTLRLYFSPVVDDGFNPGESVGFSIDMDPNSVAGTRKRPLDQGAFPKWDVGGVSGAELIGSRFTVTFDDDTTAQGQLHGTNTQAGSHGLATQAVGQPAVALTANQTDPGHTGTYAGNDLRVVVTGPAGRTARVILTRGFIQPVTPYNDRLHQQLDVLAAAPFPANNAVEFQTVDVELTGEPQDISDRFTPTGLRGETLTRHPDRPFSVDSDKLPLGLVAAVVNPDRDHLPLGPVSEPIYLTHE
ncbi:MAG: hypothetical protein AAF800_14640 [Planctomycetota bacterium]